MYTQTKKSGASASQNGRQNWRAQVLLACAFMAALLTPLAAIAQNLQTPAGDAVGQVGVLRGQVSTLAQHVGGFQAQLDAARTCPDGFHRLSVRLPVSGAYVTGCFNTRNPCDDTVRNAESVLIRDHQRLGRLESSVRVLQRHQGALEQVVTAFLDCGDRDSCVEAANEARERLEDAYNASIQLSSWAIQQNDWDTAAVAEFQRLQQDAQRLLELVTNLEQWRTDVVTPKLAALEQGLREVRQQVGTTQATLTENENRLNIDPHLSFLQATCGNGQDCWSMGMAGVTIDGRVTRTSQFFGQFSFGIGWGRTNRSWGTDVTALNYALGFGYRVGRFSISAGAQGLSLIGSYVGGGTVLTVWGPFARASVDLGPIQGHVGVGGGFGSGAGEDGFSMVYQFATVEAGVGFRFRAL